MLLNPKVFNESYMCKSHVLQLVQGTNNSVTVNSFSEERSTLVASDQTPVHNNTAIPSLVANFFFFKTGRHKIINKQSSFLFCV